MPRIFNMPLYRLCQKLFFIITLSMVSSFVCGVESVAPVISVDEPREVPGYIIVAVIFNVSLAIVILFILKKEWDKRKAVPKVDANANAKGERK